MKHSQSFISSFRNAFNGLFRFFRNERNARVQLLAGVLAIAASFTWKVSFFEWIIVLLCIAIVISLEMMNSALEKLCDLVHPGYHPVIKTVKDVSAAAVLWASVISALIGILIFLPRLIEII